MIWARVMAPLSGGEGDRHIVAAAAALAEPFEAELACVHAPPDVADLIPWMGDGFMGGVQASAVDAIREAASEGAKAAATIVDGVPYAKKTFRTLASPVWAALALHSRLSDVVVFDDSAAKGRGPLAEVFQQIVADEQRPTLVAREFCSPNCMERSSSAVKDARLVPIKSRLPERISASNTRRFTFCKSIRRQRSGRLLYAPPRTRSSMMASTAAAPTPLMAPMP